MTFASYADEIGAYRMSYFDNRKAYAGVTRDGETLVIVQPDVLGAIQADEIALRKAEYMAYWQTAEPGALTVTLAILATEDADNWRRIARDATAPAAWRAAVRLVDITHLPDGQVFSYFRMAVIRSGQMLDIAEMLA